MTRAPYQHQTTWATTSVLPKQFAAPVAGAAEKYEEPPSIAAQLVAARRGHHFGPPAAVPPGQPATAEPSGGDHDELGGMGGVGDGAVASRQSSSGLPSVLKTRIEHLSGLSLDDVRVHYNSPEPARLQAFAYTQGNEIHLAPQQERHLAHEGWHVVQQKSGRVEPMRQLEGVALNDDARLEQEATVMGNRVQSGEPAAVEARTPLYRSTLEKNLQRRSITQNAAASLPIQCLAFGDMQIALIAESNKRKSNRSYNLILAKLQQAAKAEASALTAGEFTKLIKQIDTILGHIPQAHSKQTVRNQALENLEHSLQTKRQELELYNLIRTEFQQVAKAAASALTSGEFTKLINQINTLLGYIPHDLPVRNQALENLEHSLQTKRQELQRKVALDRSEVINAYPVQRGAKAGFEIEFSRVLVINLISDLTPYVIRYLRKQTPSGQIPVMTPFSYPKRAVLFTSPHGTWEGQADSTLEFCSNLEIVTKPLTKPEWKAMGGIAEQDHVAFTKFVGALKSADENRLLFPKELHPEVKLNVDGVRLFKLDSEALSQMQMTAALPVPNNPEVTPDWWLHGLNWNAYPYLQRIIAALKTTNFGIQSNPKSGAFLKDRKNVILKTPILWLLGKPSGEVPQEAKKRWIEGVATSCGITKPDAIAGEALVATSRRAQKRHLHLQNTTFTWEEYLSNLLENNDLVTEWAKTAFSGVEDIGLGQITDTSIDATYAIEEDRQLEGNDNYLTRARNWAGPDN